MVNNEIISEQILNKIGEIYSPLSVECQKEFADNFKKHDKSQLKAETIKTQKKLLLRETELCIQ